MSEAGIAPQLTPIKGRAARLERRWIARATSSLPVPVSPKMSTVESASATLSTAASTLRNGSEEPTISSNIDDRPISARSAAFSRCRVSW